ncbi:unnamed protein product, partial [Polarella glacialis]
WNSGLAAASSSKTEGGWLLALELLRERLDLALVAPGKKEHVVPREGDGFFVAAESLSSREAQVQAQEQQQQRQLFRPDVYSHNAVLLACARAKRWGRALALLRDMRVVWRLRPDLVSFNTALSSFPLVVVPEEASEASSVALLPGRHPLGAEALLLDAMRCAGVAPDATSWAAVLLGAAFRRWDLALALLLGPGPAARPGPGSRSRKRRATEQEELAIRPDVVTFNAAICNGGQLERASGLRSQMSALRLAPNAVTFRCIAVSTLHRFCVRGDRLRVMQRRRTEPNAVTYKMALASCSGVEGSVEGELSLRDALVGEAPRLAALIERTIYRPLLEPELLRRDLTSPFPFPFRVESLLGERANALDVFSLGERLTHAAICELGLAAASEAVGEAQFSSASGTRAGNNEPAASSIAAWLSYDLCSETADSELRQVRAEGKLVRFSRAAAAQSAAASHEGYANRPGPPPLRFLHGDHSVGGHCEMVALTEVAAAAEQLATKPSLVTGWV